MQQFQFRRERPTLRTAHDFLQGGLFTTNSELHLFSGAERLKEIERIDEDLRNLVKREFPRTQNLEYAILKSHIIVEYSLIEYIRFQSAVFVRDDEIKLTFKQRLEVAYLLGFGVNDPILLPTVERLNKVRNQVAHTFNLDRGAVDEMLRINSDSYESFDPASDKDRVSRLRSVCADVCGRVSGEIWASHTFSTKP